MDPLEATLRTLAAARGLVGLGICTAAPFAEVRSSIEERKQAGLAARLTFTYGDPATSTDIRSSLPWARRLIVGAAPYRVGALPERDASEGRIARFAARDAYAPLRRALEEIATLLVANGYQAEVLVDDNRLVDRAAAVRAGVGWWGKNTMILVPGDGPWNLLGSVATDAPLETTQPMVRSCGTCTACLPACPTGALVEPGVLDARRCLAAIAQAPGPIPREFREAMGDRIYGCDDCLEACPPGRRRLRVGTAAGIVDVVEILRSADRTLLERFATFYIPRRQPRYLRRNALVVLGNAGETRFVGVLAAYAGHPDPLLRLHAVWALGRIGSPFARAALEAAGGRETRAEVREEIGWSLEALRGRERVR
jgi:epoxyqueuosine reductase